MTTTQTAALQQLRTAGTIYCQNGVSRATAKALVRLGHAKWHATIQVRTTSRGRTATDLDWWVTAA
jgi:hypothetical protein